MAGIFNSGKLDVRGKITLVGSALAGPPSNGPALAGPSFLDQKFEVLDLGESTPREIQLDEYLSTFDRVVLFTVAMPHTFGDTSFLCAVRDLMAQSEGCHFVCIVTLASTASDIAKWRVGESADGVAFAYNGRVPMESRRMWYMRDGELVAESEIMPPFTSQVERFLSKHPII